MLVWLLTCVVSLVGFFSQMATLLSLPRCSLPLKFGRKSLCLLLFSYLAFCFLSFSLHICSFSLIRWWRMCNFSPTLHVAANITKMDTWYYRNNTFGLQSIMLYVWLWHTEWIAKVENKYVLLFETCFLTARFNMYTVNTQWSSAIQ